MSPRTRSSTDTGTPASAGGEDRTVQRAPAHSSTEADWLQQSFIHARDLLSQIDYGAAINTAIAKVQALLEADSASVCLLESGSLAVQHLLVEGEDVGSPVPSPEGADGLPYEFLADGAVVHRHGACASCRLWQATEWCASAALYAEGRQIGTVCAMRYSAQTPFSAEQLRLLQALATWAAVAIANARKVRAEQEILRTERERIAAHLHDNAAHCLSVIGLKVDQIEGTLGAALPDDTMEQLQTVKRMSHQLMTQVRAAFGELREAAQPASDLVTALASCVESFTNTVGLPVEFKVTGACALPGEVQAQAIQIVREALNNVGRHAQASRVQVKVLGDRHSVRITVQDNGVGFDLHSVRPDQRHLGTLLMHERAQRSGGSLLISSHPGHGTQVTLAYPAFQPSHWPQAQPQAQPPSQPRSQSVS